MNWLPLTASMGLDQRMQPTTDGAQSYLLEANNLSFAQAGFFVVRLGMASVTLTSSGITGVAEWLGRHVPNSGTEELWANSNNSGTANLARRSAGTWATVTYSDTVTVADLRYHHGVTHNGKFFLAYNSDVNRLHVWDGTALRRAGISKPSAPTVANTGSGTYAATARRYRVQFYIQSGTDVIASSELSDAVSFTPSGSGTHARVTKPTTPDSATHWAVYGLISTAGDTYTLYEKISSNIAVGTTTYDDNVDPASYNGDFPPTLGRFIPPPSCKYLASDGAHLILAGAWESSGSAGETTPKANRVWFSAPLGTTDQGDDESIPQTTSFNLYLDVGDAGPVTGLAGPIYGDVYVFKTDSVYKLIPTGDAETPFRALLITDAIGAVDQRVICKAENGEGNPTIYFASRTGVYTITSGGVQELSEPIRRDLRVTTFTAAASWLAFDPLEKTLIAYVTSSAPTTQGRYSVFGLDVATARWTGLSFGTAGFGWILGTSRLGIDTTLGAAGTVIRAALTAQDANGVPRLHVAGQNYNAAGVILAYGGQGGRDGSDGYGAALRLRLVLGLPEGRFARLGAPTVFYRNPVGAAAANTILNLFYIREDGYTAQHSVTLTSTAANDPMDRQYRTFEDLQLADTLSPDVYLVLGSSGSFATTVPVAIDTVLVPYEIQEPLAP